jgi:hypothetical protein
MFASMKQGALALLVQRSLDGAHGFLEGREISHNDQPDRLKVQDVPHAGYRWPVDLGVPLLVRFADALSRLA